MEYSVGTVIFDNQITPHKVLLIKQKHGGHIGFPKGHIEQDESIEETALRETQEEVGLKVLLTNISEHITYTLPNGKRKKVTYFLAFNASDSIQIQEEEIVHADFYEFEEAYTLLTYQNDRDVLHKFINRLKEVKS